MSQVTLFTDILPEEQERMRVCFQAREVSFHNHEIIFAYSNTMNKIGLILSGRAVLYYCDEEGNQYMIDELKRTRCSANPFCFLQIPGIITCRLRKRRGSCSSTTPM